MKKLLFLLILSACVEQGGYDGRLYETPEQREESTARFPFSSFSTRLTNNLQISGTQCAGGEVADEDGTTFTCESWQWLVVVDNVNTCTPEGCTNITVQPLIAELLVFTDDPVSTFYEIAPTYEIDDEVDNILDTVRVRFRSGEAPVVMFP